MSVTPAPLTTDALSSDAHTYVDWCAIALGTVMAAAISIVLFTFGTGIGLSMVSPYRGEGVSASVYFIVLGLWVLWVEVSSFMAGGYLAGRMRRRTGDATEHEVDVRDGAHGLGVWAFGVVIVSVFVVLGATTVGTVIGGSAAQGAATGAAVSPQDNARTDYVVDSLLRMPGAAPAPMGDGGAVNAAEDGDRLMSQRQELGRILTFGVARGELSSDNRAYVARVVAERTGLSTAEAEARVDRIMSEVRETADKARKAGVITAFLMAAALLVAGAASAWAATLGGKHRDQGTNLGSFWAWR